MSKELDCPKCPASPMESKEVGGVSVDECPRCGGQWFDVGELAELAKDGGKLKEAIASPLRPRAGSAFCPHCHGGMINGGLLSELLRADFCSACGGLWLDKNELPLIQKLLDA